MSASFSGKYAQPAEASFLDLSAEAIESDALSAAIHLRTVANFIRHLSSLDDWDTQFASDWGDDADRLEHIADTLSESVSVEALERIRSAEALGE